MKASFVAMFLAAVLPVTEAAASELGSKGDRTSQVQSSTDCRRASQRKSNARRRRGRSRPKHSQQVLQALETPRFRPAEGGLVPEIRAAAGVVYDSATGERLWGDHADQARPIASITKVMSMVVALEFQRDPDEMILIERSDVTAASKTKLRARTQVRYADLLDLAMVASDNAAVRAIARTSPVGMAGFVARMNARARELGLNSMHFAEPTGLDHHNVSSPADLARLMTHAVKDERITSKMLKAEVTAKLGNRTITYHNTNRLLGRTDIRVFAGKTGYIDEAGHCFASVVADPVDGRTKAVVVLGAAIRPAVFAETRHLLRWATAQARHDAPTAQPETPAAAAEALDAAVANLDAAAAPPVPDLSSDGPEPSVIEATEVLTAATDPMFSEASSTFLVPVVEAAEAPAETAVAQLVARDAHGCMPARF